jgi:predicted RNA binding protein YcfA (HicA-like mRNA interferase family)
MKVRDVIKLLESDGWHLVNTKGSHRHFKHAVKRGKVTVAPPGTLNSILRQAGLK